MSAERGPAGGDQQPLTAVEARAIAAVLDNDELQAAAKVAHVSDRHLRRLLQRPHVRAELGRRGRDLFARAGLTLSRGAERAAKALISMADGTLAPSASRVAACREVLAAAARAVELVDLEERIEQLETLANGSADR